MNNNQKQVAPLQTITASTLMNTQFDPLSFSIEKLLPQGIFILAGSGKIGKLWLALDMCVAVATGGKLWDYNAFCGDVLYLALEDTHPRLQSRQQTVLGRHKRSCPRPLLTVAYPYHRACILP